MLSALSPLCGNINLGKYNRGTEILQTSPLLEEFLERATQVSSGYLNGV